MDDLFDRYIDYMEKYVTSKMAFTILITFIALIGFLYVGLMALVVALISQYNQILGLIAVALMVLIAIFTVCYYSLED